MIKWLTVSVFLMGVYVGVVYQEEIMHPFEKTPAEKFSQHIDVMENAIESALDDTLRFIED